MDTGNYTELAPGFSGRVLTGRVSDGYEGLARLLQEDETLYVLHDQYIKKVPVSVFSQHDLDVTIGQHNQGLSLSYELVAAPTPAPFPEDVVVVIIVGGKPNEFGGFSLS